MFSEKHAQKYGEKKEVFIIKFTEVLGVQK